MLRNTNIAPIQKAVFIIEEMSADETVQEMARLREKALHDEATALGHAERNGMKKGMEIGEEKGMKKGREIGKEEGAQAKEAEMIEKMKKSGMTDGQIKAILDILSKGNKGNNG